jgi:hypothetical protein
MSHGIALAPEDGAGWMGQAVVEAGGRVVSLDVAEALIGYGASADLQVVLKLAPHLRWIQLPSAGRGPAKTLFDARVTIVGAGGISEEVVQLLRPFRARSGLNYGAWPAFVKFRGRGLWRGEVVNDPNSRAASGESI